MAGGLCSPIEEVMNKPRTQRKTNRAHPPDGQTRNKPPNN
jgi:hypothetical protein